MLYQRSQWGHTTGVWMIFVSWKYKWLSKNYSLHDNVFILSNSFIALMGYTVYAKLFINRTRTHLDMTKATIAKIARRTPTVTPMNTSLPPEDSEGVISIKKRKESSLMVKLSDGVCWFDFMYPGSALEFFKYKPINLALHRTHCLEGNTWPEFLKSLFKAVNNKLLT